MVELADYDLALKHKPGKENKIADALSRRPDYDTGEDDNKGVVVLPETMFIKTATLNDPPPSSTLNEAIITAQATNFALLDPLMLRPGLEVRTLSGILGHRYPKGGVEGCSTSVPNSDNRS